MSAGFAPGDLVHARGREWVVLESPLADCLCLRPLSGAEDDATLLIPALETKPPRPARFELPENAAPAVQATASLLGEALRLSLRRGAGPFRSAASLNFEPHAYQLVPLLMALRLKTPRLLIADDVGVGKTIEAGLILREFMDRGEVEGFAVLCPPHLIEQWTRELDERFGIEATAVTAASAARLERRLPVGQSLFDEHRHSVVSLDYIKSERRRDAFARACPDFVIVDEAHACVGTHQGVQQRHKLLRSLAERKERAMVMLTATPHSGDEQAFARLLALLDDAFESLDFANADYRASLARHFVQRRRVDLIEGEWDESGSFPKHQTSEHPYRLNRQHAQFHEAVLDYCFEKVQKAGEHKQARRLAAWGTLALMRCVGSSAAAALRALRNRAASQEDQAAQQLESQIYDSDGEDEDALDLEPGTTFQSDSALGELLVQAEDLQRAPDPKIEALIKALKPLIKLGCNPVVFCRFLATADYVSAALAKAFPKLTVECVTGALTPDERRERVYAMDPSQTDDEAGGEEGGNAGEGNGAQRILVATDCLSEGINLQQLFDAVVHYDLSWNPTRHQQREGRVDRFGQPRQVVRSIMMYSPDSAIDGAVLEVIQRKADEIREATGVTVPLPDEYGPVNDALMAALALRRSDQIQYDLGLSFAEGGKGLETHWRDAEENEKKSRSRFAQNALKPEHVAPQWAVAQDLVGSPQAARQFTAAAMARFGVSLSQPANGLMRVPLDGLPRALQERLADRGLVGLARLAAREPAPAGAALASRAHPLVATLAQAVLEAALEPQALPEIDIGRVGAWLSPAVASVTDVLLLRLRFKITVRGRATRLLLAEEAAAAAFDAQGLSLTGEEARDLLAAPASGDLTPAARERKIASARAALQGRLRGPLADYARERGRALEEDHRRLRDAFSSGQGPSRVSVEPVLPADVIGMFTLIPGAGQGEA